MIFGELNPDKIWDKKIKICPSPLSDVATLPWEIQNRHFQQYYSYSSDYLGYFWRKQTVIHLSTAPKMPPH